MIHLPCSARHGFNPSIGLTSVPTSQRDDQRDHLAWFQSLNRAYKRSDRGVRSGRDVKQLFQSLNRAYKRSDQVTRHPFLPPSKRFQSLNRAYKRSDSISRRASLKPARCFNPSIGLTSVPTWKPARPQIWQGRFQSLNRAYKRSDEKKLVSCPSW